jgi:hypothetical protein
MPIPRTLLHFFKHPLMYIPKLDFDSAVSFLQGFNLAREGEILAGFREWLVVKVGNGNNLAWYELVLRLAYPEPGARPDELPATDQGRLVGLLFATFEEFWKVREEAGGDRELLRRHATWLRTQDWYQEAPAGRER